VNLRTAKAISIELPTSILLRAGDAHPRFAITRKLARMMGGA
jgi:hypothetical protein